MMKLKDFSSSNQWWNPQVFIYFRLDLTDFQRRHENINFYDIYIILAWKYLLFASDDSIKIYMQIKEFFKQNQW